MTHTSLFVTFFFTNSQYLSPPPPFSFSFFFYASLPLPFSSSYLFMREPDRSCRNDASGDAAVAAPTSPRRRRRMDWLMVLVLMFMYFGIYLIHPFQRFVGSDMITHLKCPLITVTVPFWTVPVSHLLLFFSFLILSILTYKFSY